MERVLDFIGKIPLSSLLFVFGAFFSFQSGDYGLGNQIILASIWLKLCDISTDMKYNTK